jgi:PIN domain nuclease of toxin-antitoxin system
VLLDTHIWVWLVGDVPRQIGPRTRRRLARATGANALSVSVASAFEIAALHTAGRLQFTQPVERWIRESIARSGFRVLNVDRDISIDAGLVPESALPDPLDRVLVATARDRDLPMVTRDRAILEYAQRTGLVQVVDASD